jgi:hypothetical protein
MTEECITPLRRRMIEDMSIRVEDPARLHPHGYETDKIPRPIAGRGDQTFPQERAGLSGSWLSGQYRNSPSPIVGGYASLPKKNRSISREASGPC